MSHPSKTNIFLAWLVLAVAAYVSYSNTFHVPFYFDDREAITDNPSIETLSWSTLNPPSEHCSGAIGRPLVNYSLAINYAISQRVEWSYHVLNLIFHVLTAWLLLAVLWRTLQLPTLSTRFGAEAFPLAFLIALVWELHPLVTETVTNAIQRDESMVAIFYLLAFYCFIRSLHSSREIAWQAGAIAACFVGMAAKEVMMTAPLLIFLYDRTFVAGSFRTVWEKRKVFYAALASSWVALAALLLMDGQSGGVEGMRLIVLAGMLFLIAWVRWRPDYVIATSCVAVFVGLTMGANQRGGTVGFGLGMSPWTYALKQCDALMDYFRLSLWPRPLILDYGTDIVQHLSAVLPQALTVVALLAATTYALVRKPKLGFAGAWVFVILAPSSSFLPLTTQTEAEHRMYLPLAALVVLAVLGLYTWAGRRSYLMWGILAIALGSATYERNKDYQTELSMWTVTVRDRPENPRAHYDLGCALLDADPGKASAEFAKAIELDPDYTDAHCNLGLCYTRAGSGEQAIAEYWTATWIDPDDMQSQFNLGCAYDELGELSSAMGRYRAAVMLDPTYADAQAALGSVLLRLNEPEAAIVALKAALALEPNNPTVLTNYADALTDLGEAKEYAITILQQVLADGGDSPDEHKKLASALADDGQMEQALMEDAAVIRLRPSEAEAYFMQANHLAKTGNNAAAEKGYMEALKLKPEYAEAENGLGEILQRLGRTDEARAAFEHAIEINDDLAEAHFNLGTLQLEAKEFVQAQDHFLSVLEIDPGNEDARKNLAAAQAALATESH